MHKHKHIRTQNQKYSLVCSKVHASPCNSSRVIITLLCHAHKIHQQPNSNHGPHIWYILTLMSLVTDSLIISLRWNGPSHHVKTTGPAECVISSSSFLLPGLYLWALVSFFFLSKSESFHLLCGWYQALVKNQIVFIQCVFQLCSPDSHCIHLSFHYRMSDWSNAFKFVWEI